MIRVAAHEEVLEKLKLEMEGAHTFSVPEVLEHLNVSEAKGLSSEQVKILQEKYGPNGEIYVGF